MTFLERLKRVNTLKKEYEENSDFKNYVDKYSKKQQKSVFKSLKDAMVYETYLLYKNK